MATKMNHAKINTIVLVTLVSLFCAFVIFNEKKCMKNSRIELHEQAQVIENSLWNLDPKGPVEYLQLAARLNNYERITIFAVKNKVFVEVDGQESGLLDQLLINIGLIPRTKLEANIFHNGLNVGRMEVIHRHDTIYLYLYLLLVMGLILVVANLFTRTLHAKQTLERRVQKRTEELQNANKELLLSEERYREIFNAPSDAIFMHDADTGKILDVNQGMLAMYGYTFEEALQQDIGTISSGEPPYTLEEGALKVQSAVLHGPQLFEWICKKKNGELFWTEVGLKYTEFSGQRYVIAVVRDINDRKLAEEQLEKSKALLESLIDSIPDLIFYKDKESVYLGCNAAFTRFVAQDKEAIIGRTDLDLFPKDIAEFFREKDRQMLAEGVLRRNEEWVDYPDGRHVLLDTLKTPFCTPDNKVVGLIGVSRDITERQKAEEALAAEKERLAVTLRSIGDGVITTDIDGNIVLMNKIAEKLTGWSQEEASNKPLTEVFHIINEKTRERCENPVEKVLVTGKIIGLANHTALIAKDGTERSIADSGAPIRDTESRIIGVVLVFRDVTEKNRMEEELLKVKKLESVGVLAGGIAHDFNNILMAILGNLSLATQYINREDKAYHLLVEAEKASLRAKDLTQQLLTFSRGGEPVKETTSIQEIIKDSANFVLHGGRVAYRYHIPEDLWFVEIDKGQMSQVIQNLIINASHAMPEGGIIEITCENISKEGLAAIPLPKKDYLKITISDSGIGIPENIIGKIFDPYFSTKQEGSGLGLAVTHSIIIKHDGHISVKSKPGQGTTFTIYLPASEGKQPAEMKEAVEIKTASKGKIMIMDDEEMVRTVGKAMLSRMGHEVVLAKDGEEAIEVYKKSQDSTEPVDLIIMDLTIPGGMGGEEAVQEIHKINSDAKVIVSSGYSNDPILANYREYGFCAAIVKPYQFQELMKTVNQVLT